MELSVAIGLIEQGVDKTFTPQVWADLGAGRGLFTRALADILPGGSTVYAIDKSAAALKEIEPLSPAVTLKKIQTDFVREEFAPEPPDGILMANALHFVENKIAFIKKIRKKLQPSGRLIIVEYDLPAANAWVPYPVHFTALEKLAKDTGFTNTLKLSETPSLYNRANIYSALLRVS
jgi:trans-aconitate methyltransferase